MRLALGLTTALGALIAALAVASMVAAGGIESATATPNATASTTELPSTSAATLTPTPEWTATRTATPIQTARPRPTDRVPPSYYTPTPNPGLNFWVGVAGVPGCSTQHGDTTCYVSPGGTFVIGVYLDPLPPEIPSYGGFDIALRHTGVIPNHDASTAAWPDCAFPAAAYDEYSYFDMHTDIVAFACAVGVPPAGGSTYSGLIGTNSFVCSQSGSVSLVPGINSTDIVEFDDISRIDAEDIHTSDKLTINCAERPVLPPAGIASSRGSQVWPSIAIALCTGAAFVALGAWVAHRRTRARSRAWARVRTARRR